MTPNLSPTTDYISSLLKQQNKGASILTSDLIKQSSYKHDKYILSSLTSAGTYLGSIGEWSTADDTYTTTTTTAPISKPCKKLSYDKIWDTKASSTGTWASETLTNKDLRGYIYGYDTGTTSRTSYTYINPSTISTYYQPYNSVADSWGGWLEDSPKESLKTRIRSNLVIQVKSRAETMSGAQDNERVAIETLREGISESEFRRYMKYGFILVKGGSGDTYQIFRNRSHTKVWRGGKVVEEICVRIKDSNIPLTDNLISFKAMIETDEVEFKKLGNVYKMVA